MKHIIFELRKIKTRNCEEINKLPNAKKLLCSRFKIATGENFQGKKKMLLYRRGVLVVNGDTDRRAIHNKYSPVTTSLW